MIDDHRLILLPSLPAVRRPDGRVVLTKKFISGVMAFAERWEGPVRVLMEATDEDTPNLDNVELGPSDAPFELRVIDFERELDPHLVGGRVALGTVSHRQNHLAEAAAAHGVRAVYTAEYTLATRIQILESETPNPLLRARRAAWARRQERRQLESLRRSAGVQCNGTPTYEAYRALAPDPLLFFDTRTTRSMVLAPEALEARLALRTGPLRLAFSGRLDPMKGADHLPKIADALRRRGVDFRLAILGDGQLRAKIAAELRERGLEDRVTLMGVLDFASELVPFMKSEVDLFVCPHVQGDPSCTYLETFAAGVPIAGYDNEAFAGLAREPVGWTSPLGDPEALADLIARVDAGSLAARSRRALAFAAEHDFEATMDRRVAHLERAAGARPTVRIFDMPVLQADRFEVLDRVFGELGERRGGWLLTANIDFLRRWVDEPEIRALYAKADLVVADGMPLVWASRVLGHALPERVAGSELIWLLANAAARAEVPLYLLGGAEGAAAAARDRLIAESPGLEVVGCESPRFSSPPSEDEILAASARIEAANPGLVLVALGSPKQERLIERLRPLHPARWFVGVGISFSFVAGHVDRAPRWMQRTGLEWVHRLSQEPSRLWRRYLVEDLPFAARLLAHVARRRLR